MADDGKQYLSLEEVAERLGVHYQLIYRLVRSGELPAIRLGRIYRVEAADLEAFLQAAKRHVHAEDMTGESCGACGRVFRSRHALRQACEACGRPYRRTTSTATRATTTRPTCRSAARPATPALAARPERNLKKVSGLCLLLIGTRRKLYVLSFHSTAASERSRS